MDICGYFTESSNWVGTCPCDASIDINIPPFVGRDYFCESGDNSDYYCHFGSYSDPLWSGQGCSSCCSINNPPYFTKQLSSPTSDPIEARLCRWDSHADDTPVKFMEADSDKTHHMSMFESAQFHSTSSSVF